MKCRECGDPVTSDRCEERGCKEAHATLRPICHRCHGGYLEGSVD